MPAQLFSRIRRLGVLTGGGDVPGINVAIKGLVYRAHCRRRSPLTPNWTLFAGCTIVRVERRVSGMICPCCHVSGISKRNVSLSRPKKRSRNVISSHPPLRPGKTTLK